MDIKTIYVKTRKGEEAMQSSAASLPGDVKRALLMVDGTATFGEINKRAAPSLRASIEEIFKYLEKNGLIQVKTPAGQTPRIAMPPGMIVPVKTAASQQTSDEAEELDFLSGFTLLPPEATSARQADSSAAKAQEKSRRESEMEKINAQREAEALLLKAEQEAARIREETARRAREEVEGMRLKAEQEARKIREDIEAARLKTEQEAKLRLEAATRERQQAEAERIKAEQEAARIRSELEAARLKTEQETKARLEAAARERQQAEAERIKAEQEAARIRSELEAARLQTEQEAKARLEAAAQQARLRAEEEAAGARATAALMARANEADKPVPPDAVMTTRSTIVTVLFFDVVGYTKQSVNKQIETKRQFNEVVSGCLESDGGSEHIILDTGDGAAIGFLHHPEDALNVAIKFRKTVTANQHLDYPDLKVRIGIHVGPINISKDMNGRSNMVGDGINDAQRIMSFADIDQIYVSRAYYDFVSRLNDEYAGMFHYRGMQEDKHGREHSIYELIDTAPAPGTLLPSAMETAATKAPAKPSVLEADSGNSQSPAFVFDAFQIDEPKPAAPSVDKQTTQQDAQRPITAKIPPPAQNRQPAPQENKTEQEKIRREAQEQEQRLAAEAKALADAQARVWAEAEQRAMEMARANAGRVVAQPEHQPEKPVRLARAPRKPFAWGKLGGFIFKLGIFLLVLLAGALLVIPHIFPLRDYIPKVQQQLSARLQQPVHIGYLSGRFLPLPRLDIGELYIGEVKQFQAREAQINFSLAGLFNNKKPISSIEFRDVKVNGAALQNVTSWLQQLAGTSQYPVEHMVISQGTLDADAFQINGVEGELNFTEAGKFANANLRTPAGKFTLGINAADEKLQVYIMARDSVLPLLPNWSFDELNAKGELSNNELVISNFDARILDGVIQGNANLSWRAGWRAQGEISAESIPLQKLSKLLDGNADGSAHFQMTSPGLAGLVDSAATEGSFTVNSGLIGGMDIVETARMRSQVNLPGGRTHFDSLKGMFSYDNNIYHFRQVKINAGVLSATAGFDVTRQQLAGKMDVSLSLQEGAAPVALQIGGAIDNPTLRYAPN